MNNGFQYIQSNLPRRGIIFVVLILMTTFGYSVFYNLIGSSLGNEQNFYDLLISLFNNYLILAYPLFFLFIALIYNLGNKKSYHMLAFLRFKNRRQWYNLNALSSLLFSVVFTLYFIIQCLSEGVLAMNLRNEWSQYSFYLSSSNAHPLVYNRDALNFLITTTSPLQYSIVSTFYAIFYFFVISMVYFIMSICFKKKIWSVIAMFLLNFANVFMYNSGNIVIRKMSFFSNIIILDTYNNALNSSIFYKRLLVWILLVISTYLIGFFIISRIDIEFGDGLL